VTIGNSSAPWAGAVGTLPTRDSRAKRRRRTWRNNTRCDVATPPAGTLDRRHRQSPSVECSDADSQMLPLRATREPLRHSRSRARGYRAAVTSARASRASDLARSIASSGCHPWASRHELSLGPIVVQRQTPHVRHRLQDVTRARQQTMTGRQELDPARGSTKERNAELMLETADLAAERGLRDVQATRCASDVSLFGDRHEIAQLVQAHRTSIPRRRACAAGVCDAIPKRYWRAGRLPRHRGGREHRAVWA
jgi:hypothetical protein